MDERDIVWAKSGKASAARNRILTAEVIGVLLDPTTYRQELGDSTWFVGRAAEAGMITVVCNIPHQTRIRSIILVRLAGEVEIAIWRQRNEHR